MLYAPPRLSISENNQDHNTLLGLQGGDISARYHLSQSEYDKLNTITQTFVASGGFVTIGGTQTISGDKTFSGSLTINTLNLDGNVLWINANEPGNEITEGWGGFYINRGTGTAAKLLFLENLSGSSDNRWYLDNGDGFASRIFYHGIPDPSLFNGQLTVNNDLVVHYDLTLTSMPSAGFLTTDSNGKIIDSGITVSEIISAISGGSNNIDLGVLDSRYITVSGGTISNGDLVVDGGRIQIEGAVLNGSQPIPVVSNTIIDSFPISAGNAVFWDVMIKGGGNYRATRVSAIWDDSGSNFQFNEISTESIGDTSDIDMNVSIFGGNQVRLKASPTAGSWTVKYIRTLL